MTLSVLGMMVVALQATDTTVAVERGMRLDVRNQSGVIRVDTWNRDAVRVVGRAGGDREVVVDRGGRVIRVRTEVVPFFPDEVERGRRRRGPRGDEVELSVTVPTYLSVELTGVETDMFIVGVQADVSAETVEGAIEVRGGRGAVSVRSVEEDVRVEGVTGRVMAMAGDGEIWIRAVTGDVEAQTIDGNIELMDVDSRRVTATTVDGNVTFTGMVYADGRYRLATHDGDVTMHVPDGVNATVSVASYEGSFETSFPVVLQGSQRYRFDFTLGDGGAVVELESFDGDIFLRRAMGRR